MNWVERNHAQHIDPSNAPATAERTPWNGLCAAIEGSVASFNRLYRSTLEQVEYLPSPKIVSVSLGLSYCAKCPDRSTCVEIPVARIGLTESPDGVFCEFENCFKQKPMAILFQVDAAGDVFYEHEGKRLADSDEAAETILRSFFNELYESD